MPEIENVDNIETCEETSPAQGPETDKPRKARPSKSVKHDGFEHKSQKEKEGKENKGGGESEKIIYLGPNIPEGALHTGAVFSGGVPAHLLELFERVPEVEKLCVDVKNITKYKCLLEVKGSEPNRLYQLILRKTRGKEKGGDK